MVFHIGDAFPDLKIWWFIWSHLFKWSSPSRTGKLYWFITVSVRLRTRALLFLSTAVYFVRIWIHNLFSFACSYVVKCSYALASPVLLCLQSFPRVSTTFKPKFKLWNFNSSGFLPRREAPDVSFSVRNIGLETFEVLVVWPFWPRFYVTRSRTLALSALMKSLSGFSVAQWLEHRSAEWRSEVRFLIGTQNFFLCPTLVTRRKKDIFSKLIYFWKAARFLS